MRPHHWHTPFSSTVFPWHYCSPDRWLLQPYFFSFKLAFCFLATLSLQPNLICYPMILLWARKKRLIWSKNGGGVLRLQMIRIPKGYKTGKIEGVFSKLRRVLYSIKSITSLSPPSLTPPPQFGKALASQNFCRLSCKTCFLWGSETLHQYFLLLKILQTLQICFFSAWFPYKQSCH